MANLHIVDSRPLPWVPHKAFPDVYAQTVLDAQTGEDLEVKSIRIAPGAEIALHTHEGSAETFYVLSGEGLICTKDQAQPCYPGVCVHAKSGIVHGVKNTGDEELHLLAVFTPPTGTASRSDGMGHVRKNP